MGIIGAFQRTIIITPPLPPTKLVIICEHARGVATGQRGTMTAGLPPV